MRPHRLFPIFLTAGLFLLGFGLKAFADGGDSSAASSEDNDPAHNNYYWQGPKLYNQNRLTDGGNFEEAVQRQGTRQDANAYLLQIRKQMAQEAKSQAQERAVLNYGGNSPDGALHVTYLQTGIIQVTLRTKNLFDENTASLRSGSMDVLNRLEALLESKKASQIELRMLDELDESPAARDVDAERTLAVFSLLNFKQLSAERAAG